MNFILYSDVNDSSISASLGRPEYSYYFVLKEYRPVLERIGRVVEVADPQTEVDALYLECLSRGEPCVFLSFSPPHRTPVHLACPTLPVFAWEFSTIPNEAFAGEPRNDWRSVLHACGAAITTAAGDDCCSGGGLCRYDRKPGSPRALSTERRPPGKSVARSG